MEYKAIRGTRDIAGELATYFNYLEEQARKIFAGYGYSELRTPIFESSSVFLRSLGETTDIVAKEMYMFEDKGGRSLALRPEGTAPIVRAALENNLIEPNIDTRVFYQGAMFRYDRPQAGRYRQFYQIGAEVFGNKNPLLDFEIIKIANDIIINMGITDAVLHINSVGCRECRPAYLKVLAAFLNNLQTDELCPTCNKRKDTNILRVFDCKIDTCKKVLQAAPRVLDHVCGSCSTDFLKLKEYLNKQKISFIVDEMLVRGLDYYTGTVFEILTDKLGAQAALAAGGRYDNLVQELGGKKAIPAFGFALGEDRVVELLKPLNLPLVKKPLIFLLTTDIAKHNEQIFNNFDLIEELRAKGVVVTYNSTGKSIKSQLRTANNLGAYKSVFIEPDGSFSVKDMITGHQQKIVKSEILQAIPAIYVKKE
ncbi:MAG: histidine--tRNA ligase [bacterium]|nr:histidine--tRNA ligase [bacterium]